MDMLSAYREVGTYRGAAAMCGTTAKTVRREVERHNAGGGVPSRRERERNYALVAEWVAEWVAATKARISAKGLLPAARAAGYGGSARNFRRLVAQEKAQWRRGNHRGRRPAVWSPGEYLVIDWGSVGELHVFCAVLAWCRVRFVRFAADERAATTFALLAECCEVLGGVPKVVLADRMGWVKGGVVAGRVVPTPDYVRFATAFGFRPDFCEAADPESKGIVEHLVGYAKSDLIVAQAPFTDLGAANTAARLWCVEVNAVVHSQICAVPAERLVGEVELLGPLPSLRPALPGRAAVTRKVDRLSCVRFGSARYSVPTTTIGSTVELRAGEGRILILDTGTGAVLAEHTLVAPGEASVLDEHYGSARPTVAARAVRPKTDTEQQFCALGPIAEGFLTGAAGAGNTRLGPELGELLTLEAAHGREALLAALRRATAFRRWRASDVRSILAAGTGTPDPRPPGEALVIELPVVPTRSLADYAVTPPAGRQPATEPAGGAS
jgi:hypothetical protein